MVELVWDARRQGTATGSSGASVTIGEQAHFSPDELLAMSAAGCLMRTFLRLADESGVEILSYAATARAEPACESAASPHVDVHTFIVAPAGGSSAAVEALADRAVRLSPIAQLLAACITVTTDVQVLCGPTPAAR